MKKGDLVELYVENYAFEGKGIATLNINNSAHDFVVLVKGAYPGDMISARIVKKKKSYAEAVIDNILKPSEYRTQPRCRYFGTCGGCRQQDLIYEHQIKFKQRQVEEIFEHIGNLRGYKLEEIVPSKNMFYYRNKMEFSFSDKRWLTVAELDKAERNDKDFALGLHVPKVYNKILDIDECYLQSELSNEVLNYTRAYFKERKLSIYDTKTHTGYLRNLVIRQSQNTNNVMVNLVTSEPNENLMKEYSEAILTNYPIITTLVNNISIKKSAVAVGDYENVYHGSGFIYDKIGNYIFRISANSFFQTNTQQAEQLYKTALEYAELKGDEIVYDLYSGAGTIAVYTSHLAKEVYGFESVDSAIFDAKENLELNKVRNVKFIQADLYKSFLPTLSEIPKPDVIILDPPRSGMHKNTIKDVIKLLPRKIVYVSCNPATQARDTKMMVDEGYKLIKMRPVDMFPHTFHIENVVLLVK